MTSSVNLYGEGRQDNDYPVRRYKDNKVVWVCPFFQRWANMIARCYSFKQEEYAPSYKGVEVCGEWLSFSKFKDWMVRQDWEGKELDKDLLGDGTLYSPETCIFIEKKLNLKLRKFISGKTTGVSRYKKSSRFRAYVYCYETGKQKHVGLFDTRVEAEEAANSARKTELKAMIESNLVPEELKSVFYTKYREDLT